ncbi:Dolichyl-phosphate-glucose-glycolipid alpha-glucosyltransferase-like protein [Malassezia sympodialis ATCC 42132]|uniref:Dolichyl-phosphate-glucose-glycolipid alpha-glucosyltransferase-like protein n=1 Tax=Malassezia sympodialis (strain ATCC 42132) TaxID=1230383 RepID=UPI0002C28DFC|nr:Dolichyl-phosphate-glucose-glycolipid alpha-glucosyltransferase-like protein [Malassezia sympodialis ATCC 42132]CCU99333.1 Dolichyl-phosphate-glucose-glycolipid alpha-glucosyltransferase-like protein [Malassezia sympodialis ATCC 42132]|eukprot:XP_018740587.1 Dolichyl-phosphate-glucose-glycolipid alpha-glucosyltransferase-like protein [Malassezia sympodialis ATCC 42132]
MPKNPYPDQWCTHPNVHCDPDPNTTHQAQYGFTHLFVKIPRPLNQQDWARTIFGHATVCQDQHASLAATDKYATGVDPDAKSVNEKITPQVEEPETALLLTEVVEKEDDPPLPEDPFSGTGTQQFDFVTGLRAASQLVGLGRDVLNHPYLQQAAPPLKHITAFMSALHTPSDANVMPGVDVSQLGRAAEQLINSITSSKRSETPSQNEVEEMLSQTYRTSANEDPGEVNLADETETYYVPVVKSTENASESIHSTPLGAERLEWVLWTTLVLGTSFFVNHTVAVLAGMLAMESRRYGMAALFGWLSLWFRQNNIVWVLFMMGASMLQELQRLSSTPAEKMPPMLTLVQHSSTWAKLVRTGAIFLPVFVSFAAYLWWNDGSVVLGDKSHHQLAMHLPQLGYLFAFTLFFGWPAVVSSLRGPWLYHHGILAVVLLLAGFLAVHFGTMEHPFLLADNRHYTFYWYVVDAHTRPDSQCSLDTWVANCYKSHCGAIPPD